MKRLILALMMVVMVSPAWGAGDGPPTTIRGFLTACDGGDEWKYCYGAVMGITYMMKQNEEGEIAACYPADTDIGQRVQVFINWARANPKLWNEHGFYGIISATQEAWPCP